MTPRKLHPPKHRLSKKDRRLAALVVAERLPPDPDDADRIYDEAKRMRFDLPSKSKSRGSKAGR